LRDKLEHYFIFPTRNNRIDECMLRMLENMLLSRTFGHVCEEVTGGWGKLHNKELHSCTFHKNHCDKHMDTGGMVKLSLSRPQRHTGRLEVQYYCTNFLTLTLDRGTWLTTCLATLPVEMNPSTQ